MRTLANSKTHGAALAKPSAQSQQPKKGGSRPRSIASLAKSRCKSPEPDAAKAEAYFERALAVARQQQAKSWELRASMSLARLWRDQGKVQQARELLGSGLRVVHGRVRHARSEGGEGAAGGVGLLVNCWNVRRDERAVVC